MIISSSNKDKLTKAAEELKSDAPSGGHIIDYVVGDISHLDTQFDDVEAILKASTEKFGGKIDHIVWTAGSASTPPQEDKPSHKTALQSATTRVFGPATLFQLGKMYMTDTRHSSITISSGVAIYRPVAALAPYTAGASIEPLSRGLAVSLAPIRSNFVVLGAVQTPLLERFAGNEEMMEWFKSRSLTKTIGQADEAAEAYLFSMRCAYVTGTRIDCDGGNLLV